MPIPVPVANPQINIWAIETARMIGYDMFNCNVLVIAPKGAHARHKPKLSHCHGTSDDHGRLPSKRLHLAKCGGDVFECALESRGDRVTTACEFEGTVSP